MKQTELRRGKPPKRKKGLRPAASGEIIGRTRKPGKHAKHKRSVSYWKKKCDTRWSKIVRLAGACAICGATGRLEAAHLIPREALLFRHNLNNGLCLCYNCHRRAFGERASQNDPEAISAHGTPWAFEEWLKANRPEQYKWFKKNRHEVFTGLKIDYKQVYSTLEAPDAPL